MAAATRNLFTLDLRKGFLDKIGQNKKILEELEKKDKVGEEEIEKIIAEVYSRIPVSFQIGEFYYNILYKFNRLLQTIRYKCCCKCIFARDKAECN